MLKMIRSVIHSTCAKERIITQFSSIYALIGNISHSDQLHSEYFCVCWFKRFNGNIKEGTKLET